MDKSARLRNVDEPVVLAKLRIEPGKGILVLDRIPESIQEDVVDRPAGLPFVGHQVDPRRQSGNGRVSAEGSGRGNAGAKLNGVVARLSLKILEVYRMAKGCDATARLYEHVHIRRKRPALQSIVQAQPDQRAVLRDVGLAEAYSR